MSFVKFFRTHCEELGIQPDDAQLRLAELMNEKAGELKAYTDKPSLLELGLRLFKSKDPQPKGLYIHGPVGRGKTMMMDLFARFCVGMPVRRAHFHEFMQDVHSRIAHEREISDAKGDALFRAAASISAQTRILCFDEFEVTNIADAMIMGRLFTKLFDDGVVLITTSNIEPEHLYKDGLSRELFMPFLRILIENIDVFALENEQDYRRTHEHNIGHYYIPVCKHTTQKLGSLLAADLHPLNLNVSGRSFPILGNRQIEQAYVSFDEACRKSRGVPDYEVLVQNFTTIALDGIPEFAVHERNEAQRFKTLIDILYEHKITVYFGVACPVEQIFIHLPNPAQYARTVSRIIEMRKNQKF